MNDSAFAKKWGVSHWKAMTARVKRRIPLAVNPSTVEQTGLLDMLGKIPDAEIARRSGISPSGVCHFRQRRGIPVYHPRREAEAKP